MSSYSPKSRFSTRLPNGDYLTVSIWPGKKDPSSEVLIIQIRNLYKNKWRTVGRISIYRGSDGHYLQLDSRREYSFEQKKNKLLELISKLNRNLQISDRACKLLSSAEEADLFQYKYWPFGVLAVLHISLRQIRAPIPVEELVRKSGWFSSDVLERKGKSLKEIVTEIHRYERKIEERLSIPRIQLTLEDHLEEMTLKLSFNSDMKREVILKAKEYLTSTPRCVLAGRTPRGIISAVIYLAGDAIKGIYLTQKEVATAASITEVTLRNNTKILRKYIDGTE